MKAQEIIAQRAKQYGSFEEQMRRLNFLRKSKTQAFIAKRLNPHKCRINDIFDIVVTTTDFLRNMLFIKALRSLNATGEVYNDCIIDFCNYINLVKDMNLPLKFELNTRYFNPLLNAKGKLNSDEIKYILDKDIFNLDYEEWKKEQEWNIYRLNTMMMAL